MFIRLKSLDRLNPYFWQFIYIFIAGLFFSIILTNRAPNLLRTISISLRTGFGLVIPIIALVLYFAFRIPNRTGNFISMTLTVALFALSLAGLWASGQSQSVAISGLIPMTDAALYYQDSIRIIIGRDISSFSAMRPFFAGFLSLWMSITDRNFMLSLAVITFISSVAIYYAVREIQRTHGAGIAVFLLLMLFLYYRYHSGTSMSETLGVPLGALSLALIWRGLEKNSQPLTLFGLFVSAFALNVRPGPMFILPFMLLLLAWVFRDPAKLISWKYLFWGTSVIAISFALNLILIRILAGPSGTAFSNFSWAFYGLASGGKSFNYIMQAHPEVFSLQDPERSRTIYRMTFELMLQQPELLLQGLFQRWSMFFTGTWYSAFSFVSGENYRLNAVGQWILYGLSFLGMLKWILGPSDRYSGLVAMASIGILLSVPFVPPTDANRVRLYAASIVVFGLLPGMGITFLAERLKLKNFSAPNPEIQSLNITAWFGVVFIVLIVFGPLWVKFTNPTPPNLNVICPDGGDKIAIRFDTNSFINIKHEKEMFIDWMPNFHYSTFRRSVHDSGGGDFIIYLTAIKPPKTILSYVDYLSNRPVLAILPSNQLPNPGAYIGVCGYWETTPNLQTAHLFIGKQVIVLDVK